MESKYSPLILALVFLILFFVFIIKIRRIIFMNKEFEGKYAVVTGGAGGISY